MHRLKEGIRFDPLEFNKDYSSFKYSIGYENILDYFTNKEKVSYCIKGRNYLTGELSLFLVNDSIYPICIVSDFESKDNLGTNLLVDKDFFEGTIIDIKDDIIRIIDDLKKRNYKITIIKNLKSYIFEDIKLPDFKTLEDMNKWLDNIKKNWLKNERRKIKEEKRKDLVKQ